MDLWIYSESVLLAIANVPNLLVLRTLFILARTVNCFSKKKTLYTLGKKNRIKESILCLEIMSTGVLLHS